MSKHLRPTPRVFRLSTVADGSQLVVGADFDGLTHDLVTIVADGDETLWVRVEAGGRLVEVPLATLTSALNAAPDEVHSEGWFVEHVYEKPGAHDADDGKDR